MLLNVTLQNGQLTISNGRCSLCSTGPAKCNLRFVKKRLTFTAPGCVIYQNFKNWTKWFSSKKLR